MNGIEKEESQLLGVSVHHLQTVFLTEIAAEPFSLRRESTIHDIENLEDDEPGVIRHKGACRSCPLDGRLGAAYVHCLSGADHVGRATHMLSYSWRYSIGDIVDTLVEYCRNHDKDPCRTYVWICCLCINQHRVAEQKHRERSGMMLLSCKHNSGDDERHTTSSNSSAVDFLAEFGDRVARIGHVLAMMSPWSNPGYLERVWCIFELWTTTRQTLDSDGPDNSCQVTVVMPPKEKIALQQDLFGEKATGVDSLYTALSKTKVQNAHASVESDRRNILSMVKNNPGYAALNQRVNELLREWMRIVIVEIFQIKVRELSCPPTAGSNQQSLALAKFFNQVCALSLRNGEYDLALDMVKKAIAIHERPEALEANTTRNDLVYADCLRNLGHALYRKGDNDGAIVKLQLASKMQERLLGLNHVDTAKTYDLIGSVLTARVNYDEALTYLQKALKTRLRLLGLHHADTAISYGKIGHILYFKKEYDAALFEYQRELTICENVYGLQHPNTADAQNNTGSALKHIGNFKRALEQHQKALATRMSVLGPHPDTAKSHNNIGSVYLHMKDYAHALTEFEAALDLRRTLLGEGDPYTAASYHNLADVLEATGESDKALALFKIAHTIRQELLGKDHPNTVASRNRAAAICENKAEQPKSARMLIERGDQPGSGV